MKKIFGIILVLSFLFCVPTAEAVNAVRAFGCLIGGTAGCVDSISYLSNTDGDLGFAIVSNAIYFYEYVDAATDAEASPKFIRPDDYADRGDPDHGVWYLAKVFAVAFDAIDGSITNVADISLDTITSDAGTTITVNDDLHIGADDAGETLTVHSAGTVIMYDASDDQLVTIGPVADGTTSLGITGSLNVTGFVQGRIIFNTYNGAQTLTAAVHNASTVQMTVAGEVTMWDCETANVGDYVGLWARDAEKIEVVPASGDNFVLFDGTAMTADYELDMAATAGTKIFLLCTADDTWSVYNETAACTDGGVAD